MRCVALSVKTDHIGRVPVESDVLQCCRVGRCHLHVCAPFVRCQHKATCPHLSPPVCSRGLADAPIYAGQVVIRHDSAVTVYRQLAAILRDAIESGELAPGMPVPSESSLMQEHGISRDSVRKAMDVLRVEGLVITVQGKGTFVRDS